MRAGGTASNRRRESHCATLWAPEFGGGRERAVQPPAGEPLSQEGSCSAEEEAGRSRGHRDAPQARGSDPWSNSMRGRRERGPPLSRWPKSGGGENRVAVGVSAAAGGIGNGGQGELRAQPPSPHGSGFCLGCACGALCTARCPGAQGELRRMRSVCLQRAKVRQLTRPCPLFGTPVLQQGAHHDRQRDTGQGPSG